MRRTTSTGVTVALLVTLSAAAQAQSLAGIAREEQARRKSVAGGKVYTNDSLKPEPPPSGAAGAASPAPAAPDAAPAPTEVAEKPASPQESKKDESYWRQRMQGHRDALSRAQIFAEALQSRVNALSNDFVARDDPAQRNMIAADRQKALAELERVKQEIQTHTKAIAAAEEEGRRAGVPAGWLR